MKKFDIRAFEYNKFKNLIEIWEEQIKGNKKSEPYKFDKVEIDFKGKYVDFIDTRYYYDEKFKNKSILAPIRKGFDELDILIIKNR